MQPDSIIPDSTNPQSWNRYSYTTNSPTIYTDPSGHLPLPLPCPGNFGNTYCDINDWTAWIFRDLLKANGINPNQNTYTTDGPTNAPGLIINEYLKVVEPFVRFKNKTGETASESELLDNQSPDSTSILEDIILPAAEECRSDGSCYAESVQSFDELMQWLLEVNIDKVQPPSAYNNKNPINDILPIQPELRLIINGSTRR